MKNAYLVTYALFQYKFKKMSSIRKHSDNWKKNILMLVWVIFNIHYYF